MKKLVIFFVFNLVWCLPSFAVQHEVVQKIVANHKVCKPNYYFTRDEIKANGRFYAFYAQLLGLMPERLQRDFLNEVKDLYLMPIDKCVLKANKNYTKVRNVQLLKDLKVKVVLDTDFITHTLNEDRTSFAKVFLPIQAGTYPNYESRKSLMLALDNLSRATPAERVLVTCLQGKYQSGLVTALYQFIGEYASNKQLACERMGTRLDLGFVQMNAVGNQGHLSYDMPDSYKRFYTGFARSICEENSAEFLQNNKSS